MSNGHRASGKYVLINGLVNDIIEETLIVSEVSVVTALYLYHVDMETHH